MRKKTNLLHTAHLKNNCPICFGTEGLELTFTQEMTETNFFKKPASEIGNKIYCHTCKNDIYPVNWTDDIERVFDYNRKIAETKKHYLKVNPLFYIVTVAIFLLLATVVYLLIST